MYSIVGLKQTNKVIHKRNDKVVSEQDNKIVSNSGYQKRIHKKQNLKRISTRDQNENKPDYQRMMKKLEKFISQNTKYQGKTRPVKSKRVTKDGKTVTVFSIKISTPQEQPSIWALRMFQSDKIIYHEKPKPAESFSVIVGIYDQGKLYCMRTRKFRMPTKYDKVHDPKDIICIKDSNFCPSCEKWYKNPESDKCFCYTRLRKTTRVCHKDQEFDDDYLLEQTYIKEIQYHYVPTRRRPSSHTSTINEFIPQYTTNATVQESDTIPLDTNADTDTTKPQRETGIILELESKPRFLGKRCTIKQIGQYKMSLNPENQAALRTLVYNSTKDPEYDIRDIEIDTSDTDVDTSQVQTQSDLYCKDPEMIRRELMKCSSELSQSDLEILDRDYNNLDYTDRNKFWDIVTRARQSQKHSNIIHKLV